MRALVVSIAIGLLGAGAVGCGGASGGARSDSQSSPPASVPVETEASIHPDTAPAGSHLKGDDDIDKDLYNRYDDGEARNYGHRASAADARAVGALVKRYYAAAVADAGATACALLLPRLAASVKLGETAEEVQPPAPGLPPLHGMSCPRIMSLLFKEAHPQLALADASLQVLEVRVKGGHGIALLGFKTTPERQLALQRDGAAWKIDALLDSEIA